jgi:anti-anti-sigma factor
VDRDRRGRPRVWTIDHTAIVQFSAGEPALDEGDIQALCDQLERLIEQGHTRLVLNFNGLKYLPGALLGRLAGLQKRRLDLVRGRIQLCGLDSPCQDALRITNLDRLFDV